MKYKFVFPAIGAAVVLLGLCFPSGSLHGKLEFWMLGVNEVDSNTLKYLELMYGHAFVFIFLFIMGLGLVCTFLICVCCVFLIIFSYELKKRKRIGFKLITTSPLLLLGVLAVYIYILKFFIEVKNYFYKVIGKEDIQEIKIYKEDRSVVIDKIDFGINRPVSMES